MIQFSLLLPTRERSHLVHRFLKSVAATADDLSSVEVILYIDEDDYESARIEFPGISLVKIRGPKAAMGEITRSCYEKSRGAYVMLINDDVVFGTRGWDAVFRKAFARFPDGVALAYANDLYYGKKVCTFPVLSRKACELLGKICPPDYRRHCIDSHVFDVFERLAKRGFARTVYLPEVIFEHMHYGLGMEVYEGRAAGPDHRQDQARYLALADERERLSLKIAEVLKTPHCGHSKTSPQTASLIVWSEGALDANEAKMLREMGLDAREKRKIGEIIFVQGSPTQLHEATARARHENIVFLDRQCRITAGLFDALLFEMADPAVGVAGSLWLNPRSGRVEQAGTVFFENTGGLKESFLYRGFKASEPAVSGRRELQALAFPGLAVKKEAYLKAGGFDFLLLDLKGADLCFRIRELGKKVVRAEGAALYRMADKPSSAAAEARAIFFKKWALRIQPDLKNILAEDGFSLSFKEGVPSVAPAYGAGERLSPRVLAAGVPHAVR